MKLLLVACLFVAAGTSYGQAASPTPAQNAQIEAQPPAPAQSQAQMAEARRLEYDLNTLRSMLYQMKNDLSRVQDSAARSALLVDSQMWEWLIADMQRRANAMRAPNGQPPQPPAPVRPAPPAPEGQNPHQ